MSFTKSIKQPGAIRVCPNCSNPVMGVQASLEPDWFEFTCEPCDEFWGENTTYCIADMDNPSYREELGN